MKQKEYVNNQDFLDALIKYKQDVATALNENMPEPPIPNYIGECFMKIAEGLSHRPNFINYPHREDMIGDGIENCIMYFRNFNPERSKNAFAYFTQIIWYAFLRKIGKEKKQLYIRYKATQQFGILDEFEMMEFDDGTTKQFEMYENLSEFIENYEDKQKEKKVKVKEEKKGIDFFV
jgi:hypothetical protein